MVVGFDGFVVRPKVVGGTVVNNYVEKEVW